MNATVRKLVELLESSDLEIRIAAIRVITEMGLDTKQVMQALGRSLREPHDDLRLVALKALARLGARDVSSMVVPLILTSGPLREHAMAVISAVGQSVVPQLKSLYSQADFHGKRSVITALARIGGKPAISFLVKILPQEPFELQKHLTLSVCEALDRMPPPQQAPIYSMILRLLRSKDAVRQPQLLITGAILLGHFRGASLGLRARNELRSLAEKKLPPEVRRHAIVSYNRLLGEGKLAQRDEQFILKALCDDDWHNVAQHALSGFQKLPLPRQYLPKLVDLLHKSPHFSAHIQIFERLQASDRPEVAEAILPFLADSRFRVREAAESALRKMPASIESLFALLMKTDDLEVTQRINAILRDFPQETRQKYVERAASRLLGLFEENDPHYRSFLEFVKSLDPEPLRKRIYQKAHQLKKGKVKDKWERIASLLQLLWDNHLITAEGRYLLAVALVRMSPKDLAPASRRANLGLRVLRSLIYDDYQDLAKRLKADKDLGADDYFYLGFHFSEEGEELRPFASLLLEHVVKAYPKAKVAAAAAHKLDLQAKARAAAAAEAEAAREAAEKKAERKQKKLAREAALAAAKAQGGAGLSRPTAPGSPRPTAPGSSRPAAPGLSRPTAPVAAPTVPSQPAAKAKEKSKAASSPKAIPAKSGKAAPAKASAANRGSSPTNRPGSSPTNRPGSSSTNRPAPAIRRAKTALAAAKKASKAKNKKKKK